MKNRLLVIAVLCGIANVVVCGDDFVRAVRSGDLEKVKTLVQKDPQCVTRTDGEMAPLYWAVTDARMDVAKFLLDNGADVNQRSARGETPIFAARTAEMARMLINHGAVVNLKGQYSSTPMKEAVRGNHVGVVKALLDAGESLDFDLAVELGETKLVAKMLAVKPWLAKAPRKTLYYAAEQGNLELSKLLLGHGADPDIDFGFVNVSGPYTALTNAITGDHFDIATLLFDHGASANVSGGRNHDNLFLYAIAYRDEKYTKLMIDNGADLVAGDGWSESVTPLYVASSLGGSDTVGRVGRVAQPESLSHGESESLTKVRYLVEAGADVDARTANGATPLLGAAIAGNKSVCDYLLAHGAEIDVANACMLRQPEIVRAKLEKQPELVNQVEFVCKASVLHWAVRSGDIEIVKFVIDRGADIDSRASELEYQDASGFDSVTYLGMLGQTPLHLAAQLGFVPIVRLLLDRGANTELMAGDRSRLQTVMETACNAEQWDTVLALLACGLKVDLSRTDASYSLSQISDADLLFRILSRVEGFDFRGNLAAKLITSAAARDDNQTIDRLIAKGAELDIFSACQLGRLEDVRRLIDAAPEIINTSTDDHLKSTPIELAVYRGHLEVVRLLIDRGATMQASEGFGPLAHQSARYGHLEILQLLSSKGVLLKSNNQNGETLLHAAAKGLQPEIVRYLIEQGLDVNARDFDRETPLCVLGNSVRWSFQERKDDASSRATKTTKILLDAGADVNARDKSEKTPLHQAASLGFPGVAKQLLSLGAEVNARDDRYQTPLWYTKRDVWWVPTLELNAVRDVLQENGAEG